MSSNTGRLSGHFIWRRLHSLTGLWLVLFLMEHLLTNSQAALLLGDNGNGFVRMVNWLHNLPYLHVIEIVLLGIPILIHGVWGVRYLFTAKYNSSKSDGSKPFLKYGRNKAYTWQRITSWILVVLLTLHVVKFRFLDYPGSVNEGTRPTYYSTVSTDPGLATVSDRLDVTIYDERQLDQMKREIGRNNVGRSPVDEQRYEERQDLLKALTSVKLKKDQVLVTASSFGTVSLLEVRDTFKSPFWVAIYTIFVLSACYHGFNGLWTSMLTWGWVIKRSAQKGALRFTLGLMLIVTFLGMAAIWGTYFLNLRS